MRFIVENTIVLLIGLLILLSVWWFMGAVTAGYSGAQEATPTVDPTTVALATSIPPPPYVTHRADMNYDGVINVIDLFLVSKYFGQTGPVPVCAVPLYPDALADWVGPC